GPGVCQWYMIVPVWAFLTNPEQERFCGVIRNGYQLARARRYKRRAVSANAERDSMLAFEQQLIPRSEHRVLFLGEEAVYEISRTILVKDAPFFLTKHPLSKSFIGFSVAIPLRRNF
ncbi:MAG: hypothetical protein PHS27_01315, partial [Candidatus Pacebacteria bacterium]|nr:hypothetical protein [Candidatus Paceibacterota bacterium]